MHPNSILLFTKYAMPYFRPGIRVLEIGPDDFPSAYCRTVTQTTIAWDTLDMTADSRLTYRSTDEYA